MKEPSIANLSLSLESSTYLTEEHEMQVFTDGSTIHTTLYGSPFLDFTSETDLDRTLSDMYRKEYSSALRKQVRALKQRFLAGTIAMGNERLVVLADVSVKVFGGAHPAGSVLTSYVLCKPFLKSKANGLFPSLLGEFTMPQANGHQRAIDTPVTGRDGGMHPIAYVSTLKNRHSFMCGFLQNGDRCFFEVVSVVSPDELDLSRITPVLDGFADTAVFLASVPKLTLADVHKLGMGVFQCTKVDQYAARIRSGMVQLSDLSPDDYTKAAETLGQVSEPIVH